MIQFKQIELSDKNIIDTSLEAAQFQACDFSFTNLWTWSDMFKTCYAIVNKTLLIRFCDRGNCAYMMPVNGNLTLAQAIEIMMNDAEANGKEFKMKAVTSEMWEQIEKDFPGKFNYTHERDNAEYLYTSEKLIKLSGKKLQSKRNHINRFKADNPDWEYFPLTTTAELSECLQMLDEWEDQHENRDRSLQYDYIATQKMINNFDYLGLRGGAVRVNRKIVAFTIGEPLTKDIFVVHVEKAFSGINGAYTIINQQFAEHEAAEFKYINREEDLGLESLRKAKLSYQPDILLEEGVVTMKESN